MLRQARSLDQLHHQRAAPVALLQAVDRGNVGMVQRGQHLRFTPEARHAFGVSSEYLGQGFQRHIAPELGIPGAIDLTHSARVKEGNDLVGANLTPYP